MTPSFDAGREKHSFAERVPDLWKTSGRGRLAAGPFLTPGEIPDALAALHRCGAVSERYLFFGGYRDAERQRLYCLPDYIERSEGDLPDVLSLLAQDEDVGIVTLEIRGSGYHTLAHRDYLGAILALGLERDAMGDLIVQDEHSAILFCTGTVATFLCETLTTVANDTVAVTVLPYNPDFVPNYHFEDIADTVASPRLDCVAAALANISRDDAQKAITAGRVEVNFRPETRTDAQVPFPCIIVIRGAGKFKLLEIGEPNRRGRLRLRAQKYT